MTEKPEVTKLNHRSQSKAQGHISKQEVIQSLRSQQTKWLGSKAEGHSAKPKVKQQSKRPLNKARDHTTKTEVTQQILISHIKARGPTGPRAKEDVTQQSKRSSHSKA